MAGRLHNLEHCPTEKSAELLGHLYDSCFFRRAERKCFRHDGRSADWGLDLRVGLLQNLFLNPVSKLIAERIRESNCCQLAGQGVAASILVSGIVAVASDMRGAVVRDSRKGHGFRNIIEGALVASEPVVLVDDLLATGWTAEQATMTLRSQGYIVQSLIPVFEFGWRSGRSRLERLSIGVTPLATLMYANQNLAPRRPKVVWV